MTLDKDKDVSTGRNPNIELLRFLGAIGIIWFHTKGPGDWFGYAALQIFAILSIFFAAQQCAKTHFLIYAVSKFKRIIVPWIIWSAIYGIAKLTDTLHSDEILSDEFSLWMIFTGPSIHLWFLPYMFAASLALYLLVNGPVLLNSLTSKILIAGFVTIVSSVSLNQFDFQIPILQWIYLLPALIIGWGLSVPKKDDSINYLLSAIIVMLALVLITAQQTELSTQLFIGCCTLIVVLKLPIPNFKFFNKLGNISLGLYLIHPAVEGVLNRLYDDPKMGTIHSILVILFSILLCVLLKPLPYSRSFV